YFKCNEEGHMARECPNAGQAGGGESSFGSGRPSRREPNKCYKCNEEGHMARTAQMQDRVVIQEILMGTTDLLGGTCQEGGHRARDCPNSAQTDNEGSSFGNSYSGRSRDSNDTSQRKCYKCNGEGHFARECPNSAQCGEDGHLAKDCENPTQQRVGENGEVKPAPVTYVPTELSEEELFDQGVSVGINFSAYQSAAVKVSSTDDTPNIHKKIESFSEANLRKLLLDNIAKAKYTTPTPVQKHTIPVIMSGRDLMACAQTGSGKTAAFLLPILHNILSNNIDCSLEDNQIRPTALVLSPTRELAIQIFNEARKFANESIVRVCICYGGTSVSHQIRTMQRRGCHILVATPGRLLDFVNKGSITFSSMKFLVLDEADRMIDMGFKPDVDKVVEHPTTPSQRRKADIQQLAKNYLNDYVFVAVGIVGSANVDVKQTVLQIDKVNKREALVGFIKDQLEENRDEKILVFVETKRMADFIAVYLCNNEVNATSIHGDRFQHQREEALSEFKSGKRNVLVATAVAARGLDIKGVGIVMNFDMPKDIDEYVHRIGRTGRVGNPGKAVSYFDIGMDAHLSEDLVKLLRDAGQEVPDWLVQCSATSGVSDGSYTGQKTFGALDIRKKGIKTEMYPIPALAAFGGPLPVSDSFPKDEEEESWE
ncbi:ATP-dependent RNA helicase vasa, isoform A, partial [Armadillidium vulgare]